MSITQLNQTIQAIRDILANTRSADPEIAKDFSELFRSTNRRLNQVSVLLSQNERMQAHSLSEQAPALTDLIRAFGFEKSNEWSSLCRKQGWPHPGSFDSRQVMLVLESYGDGSKGKTSLTDEFRGKILKGDKTGAVTTLRVALRKDPKDSWARAELEKILGAESKSRILQMQKHLHQRDIKSLNQALKEYEALAFPILESELFNQIVNECAKFRKNELEEELQIAPSKFEGWKKSGDWGSALEHSDDIRGRARELGIKIGVKGNLLSLMGWADNCLEEENRKNDIKNTEAELKKILSDLEESISYREKKSLPQIRNQLGTLEQYGRRGEELKHDWSQDIEARLRKIELHLKKEEALHLHKMRLAAGTILIITLSVLSVGGWLVFSKAKSENETKRVVQAIENCKKQKTITELEKLLESYAEKDGKNGFLAKEHKAKIQSEIERANVAVAQLEKAIKDFRSRLDNPKREWDEESRAIKVFDQEIEECVIEYRQHLKDLKAKAEMQWLKLVNEKKEARSLDINKTISECKVEYEKINPGDVNAVLGLNTINNKLYLLNKENEALPKAVAASRESVENLKNISDKASKKFAIAKEIETIRSEVAQAAKEHSETKYYQAVEKLALQPEISVNISKALKAVAKISKNNEKLLAEVWIPFNNKLLLEPVDNQNSFYATATPKEKEISRSILDLGFLDTIFIYHIPDETTGTLKMRTVYSKGKIEDIVSDSRGRWSARTCMLYNPDTDDFELKKRTLLSAGKSQPIAFDEPVSRLFRDSRMRDFLEGLAGIQPQAQKISIGKIMDYIAKATDVPDSGKAYLLQRLSEVCAIRPQVYGISYLPWYTSYIQKLNGFVVKDGEWLQSNKAENSSLNIKPFPENTDSQIEFFRALVSTGMSSGLMLVGFVPESGLFPEMAEMREPYVIPCEGGKVEILDKEKQGLLPYTPIYQLKINPSDAIIIAKKKSGMSDAEVKQLIIENYPLLIKYVK